MVVFQDIEDVEDWIEPLDYIAFWEAVAPYRVFSIAERDHCDGLIAGGEVPQATILRGLKFMAHDALREKFGLRRRRYDAHTCQSLNSVH